MRYRVERHPNGKRAFPFDRMQPNDTFTIPVTECARCLQQSIATSIAKYRKTHPGKFITKNMGAYIECRRIE